MRRAAAATLAALWLLGAAASAPAQSIRPEVGIEDERLILSGGPEADAAVHEWKRIGVDVVRVHARWASVAPGRTEARKPSGFDEADHRDPGYDWTETDRAIARIRSAGLRVALTVTGPGPLWTSRAPSRRNARYKPDPRAFERFATAVATRFGAEVDRYLIWNEPNQSGWLEPQNDCVGRRCKPAAPHIYRDLLNAAGPAIERADPGAEIVFGELAPIGYPIVSHRSPIAPLPFLRAMGCVDERYRKLRSGACARFKAPAADAMGHHPHPVERAPDQANPDLLEAQLADTPRLLAVLDRLSGAGRLQVTGGGRFPVHFTEFGYQTSPPDHVIGVPLAAHARYLQHAAYLTWKWRRIRSLVHYQWDDEPVFWRGTGKKAYAGWQSGLRLITGEPKPALRAFPHPFAIEVVSGGRGRLWGQVRPGGAARVQILRRVAGGRDWRVLREQTTDASGVFTWTTKLTRGASYAYTLSSRAADAQYGTAPLSGIVKVRSTAKRRVLAADAPPR